MNPYRGPKLGPIEKVAAFGTAILMLIIFVMMGAMTVSLIASEMRSHYERQAIREALRGNCQAAAVHSINAGNVPYDVHRLCFTTEGRP